MIKNISQNRNLTNKSKSLKVMILMIITAFLFLNKSDLKSQDSYIFPDIAAPGMVTYFEIVAKDIDNSFFGSDGFSLNNSGSNLQLKVKLTQNIPSKDLVQFGPISVSWQGRLLSSYVFVSPDVQPLDWDVDKSGTYLTVEVILNGNRVAEYRIDIVKPFPFGDKSLVGEYVLGQGTLGKRSKRGAMIVDSMVLANQVYTVSRNDIDGSVLGNQGYLPFTLISKGTIRGTGVNSEINVNAVSLHGGVGGGGGAGSFCDVQLGSSGNGSNGGDGFTGGGPGGQNGTFGSTNQRKNGGSGSGDKILSPLYGGSSINGVVGGTSSTAHESAGGGTGHPFGMSGDGCSDGANCNPTGGWGAGSSYRQLTIGGSAGYATDGGNSGGASVTGGKTYGNSMGVPLMGGSGGGGGNPQGLAYCAGVGGGGGGAVRIQAMKIENVKILANGGNGGNGSTPASNGGGGSGGFIDFHTKLGFNSVSVEAKGGTNAGTGRVRFNSFPNGVALPNQITPAGSTYNGFSIDSTTYLSQTKTKIYGSANIVDLQAGKLNLYLKHGNRDWGGLGKPTIYNLTNGNWEFEIDLTPYKVDISDTDKYFYLAGTLDVSSPSTAPFKYEPRVVFSQSGANVLIADLQPELLTEKKAIKKVFGCGNEVIIDSLWATNIGDGSLDLGLVNDWVRGNQGFSLVAPLGSQLMNLKDTTMIKIAFDANGKSSGIYRDSLKLYTNLKGNNGLRYLLVEIDYSKYSLDITDLSNKSIDTIDLGKICKGEAAKGSFKVKNTTGGNINVKEIRFTMNLDNVLFPFGDMKINEEETVQFEVANTDSLISYYGNQAKISYLNDKCPDVLDSVVIKWEIVETKLSLVDVADLDFGDVIVGKAKTNTIRIKNDGPSDAYIDASMSIAAPYSVIATRPTLPVTLKKDEILEVDVTFSPTATGRFNLPSIINSISNGSGNTIACSGELELPITGVGVNSNFEYIKEIDFGYVLVCSPNKDTIFTIKNKNNKKVKFSGITNEGNNPTLFTAVLIGDPNKEYGFDEVLEFKLTFNSNLQALGFKSALANIVLTFVEDASTTTLSIGYKGTIEGLETITIPNNQIDFGDIAMGVNAGPRKITIKNTGKLPRTYSFTKNDPDITVTPSDFSLAPDEEIELDVYVKMNVEGAFTKKAVIKENDCNYSFDINIIGNSIKSEVAISPMSLDFGIKSPCMGENRDVTIENNGQIGVTFVKDEIVGTDAALFSIVNVVSNISLAKGGNMSRTIAFTNPTKKLGKFTAELKITMLENGIEIIYTIPLNVEVTEGFDVTPIELDFGDVVVNQTKSLDYILSATATWNIIIQSANPVNPGDFNYSLVDLSTANIAPSSPYNWNIDFTPNNVGPINGEVTLNYYLNNDQNCTGQIKLLMKGNGKPASKVNLSLNDMIFDPAENEVKIPVFVKITDGLSNIDDIGFDTLAISYNYTQFYPKSVENGSIINSEISDPINNRATTYLYTNKFNLDTLSQNVVSLIGTPMLGNTVKEAVNIEYAKFDKSELIGDTTIKNGSIETKVCAEGDEVRLLKNTNKMQLSVESNNDIVSLVCQSIEIGSQLIEIYSLDGELMYSNKWEFNSGMNNLFNFDVDKNIFSSGLYIAKFSSANRFKIQKVAILR